MGSALSPNGIAFDEGGMLSMGLFDNVISVNTEKMQVPTLAMVVRPMLSAIGLLCQNPFRCMMTGLYEVANPFM